MKASMSRAFQPVAFEQLLAQFGLLADGELEDLLAVLVHVVHSLLDRFLARGVQAASAGHVKELGAGTVDFMDVVDQPHGIIFRGLQNHRARAIAKDHAGGAVGVVDDRRHHVSTNHQHALVRCRWQ